MLSKTMRNVGRIVLAFLLVANTPVPARASAANIYITQTGSPFGACTTGVQTPAFFNNAANWGSGGTQIGPGTVVTICGTFTFAAGATNVFSFQGSGTSGNLITLKWDTNAIVQAPYFSTSNGSPGAIETNGNTWLLIDGGTNGIVQNTANGTGLAFQQLSSLVDAFGSSNIQIEHLAIGPVYIHNSTTSDTTCVNAGFDCFGVRVLLGGSNVTVGPGNTFTDCDVCIFFAFTGGESNLVMTGNTFNRANQAIEGGPSNVGTKVLTNVQVDHNTYNASRNWDDGTAFHHNFFHPFTGTVGSSFAGALTYFDNRIIGDVGLKPTSLGAYLENNNSGSGGTMAPWWIFNNVFYKTNTDVPTANGIVAPLSANNGFLLNNTIVDAGNGGNSSNDWPLFNMEFGTGWTEENNILQTSGGFYFFNGGNTNKPTANFNMYYDPTGTGQWAWSPGGFTSSYSSWKSFCSCDANSLNGTNPSVNLTTFVPGSAVVMGTNLNSLASGSGIAAVATYLPLDINGVARTGTWSVGAVNFPSAAPPPPGPPPVLFSSVPITILPLPSGSTTISMQLTKGIPSQTYLTAQGFSQDGITFTPSLGIAVTGANLNSTLFTLDEVTPLAASCPSSTNCIVTLPASAVSLPGLGPSNHSIAVPASVTVPIPVPVLK